MYDINIKELLKGGVLLGFDYYYGAEAEQFSFYRIPKTLIKDKRFKKLSSDAKILYGLMLDRMALSMKNGWFDEYNRVFIYYAIDDIAEDLGCSKPTCTKIMAELDSKKGVGLIEKKRQGQGKPDIIYVKNFVMLDESENFCNEPQGESAPISEVKNLNFQKSKNLTSKSKEFLFPEIKKFNPNYNYINNTEYSYTESVLSCPSEKDRRTDFEDMKSLIKENIRYDDFKITHSEDMELIDEFVEIMIDSILSNGEYIQFGGEKKPRELVRNAMLKLSYSNIEQVLWNFKNHDKKIKKKRQYILSMLYYSSMERKIGLSNSIRADWGY